MYALIGNPQGLEWLIILGLFAAFVVLPIALLVWLIVKLARR